MATVNAAAAAAAAAAATVGAGAPRTLCQHGLFRGVTVPSMRTATTVAEAKATVGADAEGGHPHFLPPNVATVNASFVADRVVGAGAPGTLQAVHCGWRCRW